MVLAPITSTYNQVKQLWNGLGVTFMVDGTDSDRFGRFSGLSLSKLRKITEFGVTVSS